MANHIIKICGIRDEKTAKIAGMAGANYLGIVFHPLSPRFVTVDQAKVIAKAAKEAGALPVGVFVDHTAVEMHQICKATDINMIQLHGEIARSQFHFLPGGYRFIYADSIKGIKSLVIENRLPTLDPQHDFILLDNTQPGRGQPIDDAAYDFTIPLPWILAGGLSPSNVTHAIFHFKPQGVDVSSGVESLKGIKDVTLMRQFISSVRGYYYA